jgi:hypothetical protein
MIGDWDYNLEWFEHPTLPAFFQIMPSTWDDYLPKEFTRSVDKATTAWERIVERPVRLFQVSPRVKARQMERLELDKLYRDARNEYMHGEIYSGKWDGSGDYIFRNIEERTW